MLRQVARQHRSDAHSVRTLRGRHSYQAGQATQTLFPEHKPAFMTRKGIVAPKELLNPSPSRLSSRSRRAFPGSSAAESRSADVCVGRGCVNNLAPWSRLPKQPARTARQGGTNTARVCLKSSAAARYRSALWGGRPRFGSGPNWQRPVPHAHAAWARHPRGGPCSALAARRRCGEVRLPAEAEGGQGVAGRSRNEAPADPPPPARGEHRC
jgi:hypothetical protein